VSRRTQYRTGPVREPETIRLCSRQETRQKANSRLHVNASSRVVTTSDKYAFERLTDTRPSPLGPTNGPWSAQRLHSADGGLLTLNILVGFGLNADSLRTIEVKNKQPDGRREVAVSAV
jgi:hypothetical protein